MNLLNEIVPFRGKHEGKPLGLILRCDRGWVEWAAENAYNQGWREKFATALKLELSESDADKPVYRQVESEYPLSVYQQAIVDAYTTGNNLAIEARAGSGKTFMLKHLASMTSGCKVKIVAFNVHIASELSEKLKEKWKTVTVQTIHSAAYSILSERMSCKLDVDGDEAKYRDIIRPMVERPDGKHDKELAFVVRELTKMARLTLIDYRDYQAMQSMANVYNKPTNITYFTDDGKMKIRVESQEVLTLVEKALDKGIEEADKRGYIDFDDMLYLVASRGYIPNKQVDVVMADEGQDFNAAQIKVFGALGKEGSQKVIVGDPFQAIQGFAYAAYDSFERLGEAIGESTRLTMPITYRCPASHVRLACDIVPDFQARPDAPEGVLEYAHSDDFPALVRAGDLVICRTTAPLIKNCIKLLQVGVPAYVRGRALHKELIDFIKKAMNFANTKLVSEALAAVEAYKVHQVGLLMDHDASESAISNFTDRAECAQAILLAYPVSSLDELSEKIKQLTVEPDDTEKVVLASGHRSKGDENKRVFVLNYSSLPFTLTSMSDEQSRQEDFVHYVIITRSSGALYLLDDGHDSILKEKPETNKEEQIEEAPYKPSENSVNLLTELITSLAEIVRGKKYKGRHTDIKKLVGQMEKQIQGNTK